MENLSQPANPLPEGGTSTEAARAFFTDEQRVLNDIAGGSGFTFKRGEGWAINPETGEATYDPKFFEERGYTPSQALFGAFHEIKCHLVETADLLNTTGGPQAHQRLKDRIKEKPRLHVWENCRTDKKGNEAIMRFAPSLTDEVETVYREKLWPETDLSDKPRHLQFMYAILRTAMVPGERVQVDPMVAAAIDKLRSVKGKDVIALATDTTQDPLLALRLSEKYIEPVIEELYQEDLKDKKGEQQPQQGQGQKGSGEPFEENYQDYESRHPEPMDEDEVERKVKETQAAQSAGGRQKAGYEAEHGVTTKDIADYAQEYRNIEKYIEPLRQIFRRIIEQRKIPVRHLAALREEGVMIDPGLIAQTYMDVRAGIDNPRTMKDFEGTHIDENVPTNFEITVVGDRTGSMQTGTKIPEQRRSCVLLMEALKEFSDMTEDQGPLAIDLGVRSEVLSFGDNPQRTEVLKPLSKELTEKQRVAVFKSLAIADSGTNNEEDMLANILTSIQQEAAKDPAYLDKIKSGKLRKFVIILTDGIVGNFSATRVGLDRLRELGVVVAGVGMTSGGEDAVKTYAPDGKVCYDVSNLPKTLEEMLSEYLGSLSIDGNPETILQTEEI